MYWFLCENYINIGIIIMDDKNHNDEPFVWVEHEPGQVHADPWYWQRERMKEQRKLHDNLIPWFWSKKLMADCSHLPTVTHGFLHNFTPLLIALGISFSFLFFLHWNINATHNNKKRSMYYAKTHVNNIRSKSVHAHFKSNAILYAALARSLNKCSLDFSHAYTYIKVEYVGLIYCMHFCVAYRSA